MNKIKEHLPETLQVAIQSTTQDSPAAHFIKTLVHKQLEVSAVQQTKPLKGAQHTCYHFPGVQSLDFHYKYRTEFSPSK